MLLALDISNTSIKVGIFHEGKLITNFRVATERHKLVDDYAILFLNLLAARNIDKRNIRGIVMACVVPPLRPVFLQLAELYFFIKPIQIRELNSWKAILKVDNPYEVGDDRIATALALHDLYKGPAIGITLGTALVFDCIDANGNYLGGAILPGLTVALDSLTHAASQLSSVELVKMPSKAIGTNTQRMIQSGLLLGYTALVEGMVRRLARELGMPSPTVVASGWHADLISSETKAINAINHHLVLEGLRLIYEASGSP